MSTAPTPVALDREQLRSEVRKEYQEVARHPERGFHFHTGRPLAAIVGYREDWLEGIPEDVVSRFAGTGNPFSVGEIADGERVVDLGCGAGIDSFIAARKTGPEGAVIGIDMTDDMLQVARRAKEQAGVRHLEFRHGFLEDVPVDDGWADVIISNGSVNLCPDKDLAFAEMARVLRPGGRLQIADILVSRPVSESAKERIDLWTG